MGKKKHKRHGHEHDGHEGGHKGGHQGDHARDEHGQGRGSAEMRFAIPPQVAGIAAAALEQVNTPAFRQLMAGALGAAAQAFDARRPTPPAPAPAPVPPVPPAPPSGRPLFEGSGPTLTPEVEQALERAAAQAGKAIETAATIAARALETAGEAMARWAEKQGRASSEAAGDHPHA